MGRPEEPVNRRMERGKVTRIYSAGLHGVDAVEVEIEASVGGGDPKLVVVGLPDAAVRESTDRVWSAIANSGFGLPKARTTVNLAPADLRKEGPMFDLAIALGVIGLSEHYGEGITESCCFAGELALNGRVRPVRGVLSLALEARRRGRRFVLVPEKNGTEAALVEGIEVIGLRMLRDAVQFLHGDPGYPPVRIDRAQVFEERRRYAIDFSDVKGQSHAKRAIEVAVAGGHNLLMLGPPGTGKSMLARRIATIMPPMTEEEAIESTKIHSVAGRVRDTDGLVATRPFRAPHHTISDVGLLGGTSNPSPGEVSLAHNGVLFLDELPEFRRNTLEVLRQPLEDGWVTISRASGSVTFPARFLLVCALNPCPCGYYGDARRECRCTVPQIQRYRQRVSGPLLDRIDLHVEVPPVDHRELTSRAQGETSAQIRARVVAARQLQLRRFRSVAGLRCNAAMPPRLVRECCQVDAEGAGLLEQAMNDMHFSARAYDRILKVARTLADLSASENIESLHVLEAIQYRSLDRQLWR